MSEHPDDGTEARLRAALAARADAVEPAGRGAEVVERMAVARDRARRRRTALAAAAAVVVVALLAGAFVLLGDDDPDTEVATGGPSTVASTTTAPGVSQSTAPVLWPLPTMSVRYATAIDAAAAFGTGYLGITSECASDDDPADGEVLLVPSAEGCTVDGRSDPDSAFTTVALEERAQGWVVTGAESSWLEVTPAAGAVVGADIGVIVTGAPAAAVLTASVPPLGQDPAGSPSVDTTTIPRGADGAWRLVLGAADGPTVLVVSDGATATARVFTVDSTAVAPGATTTTTGPTDDGTQGWPGATSRHFDDPGSAALAFVSDVLQFADPALEDVTVEGPDAFVVYRPRPTAGTTTTITVHDSGTARGWVVTDAQASDGTIDRAFVDGDVVVVRGVATAFEAQIAVVLLDLEGNAIASEEGTFAGANGEPGPFEARVAVDAGVLDAAAFVLIAEGDASGEGRYSWATVEDLASLLSIG